MTTQTGLSNPPAYVSLVRPHARLRCSSRAAKEWRPVSFTDCACVKAGCGISSHTIESDAGVRTGFAKEQAGERGGRGK